MDATLRGGMYFDGENIFFDVEEDYLLDDDEKIYMINTRGSVQLE